MKLRSSLICLFAAVAIAVTSCGSTETSTPDSSPGVTATSTTNSIPADTTPTAAFGETQEITSEGFAVGMSEYTVSKPRAEGSQTVFDLSIATKQGQCIPGVFSVLTEQGNKVESTDSSTPESFDSSGTMIAGERREGSVYFDLPAGSEVAKFVLYHGSINPPKAYWVP